MARRTKIVATLGPSPDPKAALADLIAAGVDLVRVNFSHGSFDEHARRIKDARAAAAKAGRVVGVLGDLRGPKVRIERFANREDSGGAGKFRGGLGHFRDYRVLTDGVKVVIGIDRHNYRPWGALGGEEGLSNDVLLNPGPRQRSIRKVSNFAVPKGSLISLVSGGGGGYGPARERDPESVLTDVVEGYVTAEFARRHHGVAISDGRIDRTETNRLRQQLSSGRNE